MRYLIYKSPGGKSEYLFKTRNRKKRRFRKSDTYYATVLKVLKGTFNVREGWGSWPTVKNCRPLTDLEVVTYKLLGIIGTDYEKEPIEVKSLPRTNVEVKNPGT